MTHDVRVSSERHLTGVSSELFCETFYVCRQSLHVRTSILSEPHPSEGKRRPFVAGDAVDLILRCTISKFESASLTT